MKGKSTLGALLTAVENRHRQLESGTMCVQSFFDFKKAFDSVSHDLLFKKLSTLGLDPYLLKWIASYLQYVLINEASRCSQVLSGVPQGSVLGPLFFLLFINDITSLESSGSGLILYADDLLLYREI